MMSGTDLPRFFSDVAHAGVFVFLDVPPLPAPVFVGCSALSASSVLDARFFFDVGDAGVLVLDDLSRLPVLACVLDAVAFLSLSFFANCLDFFAERRPPPPRLPPARLLARAF